MEKEIKELNEYMKKLDYVLPIMQFEQPVKDEGYATNEALARAYADSVFRAHIKNWINRQIHHASVNSNNEAEMLFNKGRITVLKELFRSMERGYKTIQVKKPIK